MQVVHVFALDVTQVLVTPLEMLPLCCLDVGHERGEVLVPGVVPIVCLVRATRLRVEKINGVGVESGEHVELRACLRIIVPKVEEIDAGLDFVLDGRDLIMGEWVLDLIEPLFGEEAVVPEWALAIFGALMKCRQDSIPDAAIVLVLDIDDRMLLGEEDWELPQCEARERDESPPRQPPRC